MLIVIKFDHDSQSWWAEAEIDERHALTTGAATFNELLKRVPAVLRNLLADDDDGEGRP